MTPETICKTVHQYNKFPISDEEMKKLQGIAEDYRMVKNYVYQRYGGKNSLSKIYPGYTVQKELGKTGLREKLGLPSVYFNVAILDALGDIKSQWTRIKTYVLKRVNKNENFSETDKHYLRFLLKVSNAFEAVLNDKTMDLKPELQKKYEELAECVPVKKLNHYLQRQVRKQHTKLHAEKAEGFSITERAYRYDNHGIYITMKEKRKRIFVELTDSNTYVRQIYLKLYPEQKKIEILVPVDVEIRHHADYTNHIGLVVGMYTMLVTDKGHTYGEKLGDYQIKLAEWVREQTKKYAMNRQKELGRIENAMDRQKELGRIEDVMNRQKELGRIEDAMNRQKELGRIEDAMDWQSKPDGTENTNSRKNVFGRKKYTAKKKRMTEQLHSYINMELNRFLKIEKPEVIYIPKLPKTQKHNGSKAINHSVTMWQRGYIRLRLQQKCKEHAVELVEVFGKDISNECSQCGAIGTKQNGIFTCLKCGNRMDEKVNAACNAKKRGEQEYKYPQND